MILQSGLIRLIDFDAARLFKAGQAEDTRLLGTRGYAPPEQYGGGQTDSRSDIYSLGVTIKTMLGADYDGRLKKILDKCTEFDPARRFQSVGEIKTALRLEQFSYWGKIFAAIFFAIKILMSFHRISNDAENLPLEELAPVVAESIYTLSLGRLKLGDTVETVHAILGTENKIRASKTLTGSDFYEYADCVVTVKNDLVTCIASYTAAIKTERGIRQGDALEKVITAYGAAPWTNSDSDGTTFYEYPFESAGGLAVMRFAVKDDSVEYISLRLEEN